jgi:nucleoside-diphosphate-sugar epimerase
VNYRGKSSVYRVQLLKRDIVIIGNGMVACACKSLSGWDEDILYASGVSNSSEHRKELFDKEIELIKFHLSKIQGNSTFVYFSTTSIMDPSKSMNAYIKHKLEIEEMLRSENVNHLIVRLPNLVGISRNPHTLTNFFAESIRSNKPIRLIKNAVRHLIDADDLSSILNGIKSTFGKLKTTVDVETNNPLTAQQILHLMENALRKKAEVIESVEPVSSIQIKVDVFSNAKYIFETPVNYHRDLINKYYSS